MTQRQPLLEVNGLSVTFPSEAGAVEAVRGVSYHVMPGEVLGAASDVMGQCHGRVVRCSLSQGQYQAAATIDEYRFAER